MSWHFTNEKIAARIAEIGAARVRKRQPLPAFTLFRAERGSHGLCLESEPQGTLAAGQTYLADDETVTLRVQASVPQDWDAGRIFVGLELTGAETLVYLDGRATQAIDREHHDLLLADPACGADEFEIALAAYTGTVDAQLRGGWSGAGEGTIRDGKVEVLLKTAELQLIDADAEALFYDMGVAYESELTMNPDSLEYIRIIDVLDGACNLLDFTRGERDDAFYASAATAREYVQENLYRKYHADPSFSPAIWATGHAHIDTAWLWQLAHTRQKVGRTFTTALALMDQYPDYRFSASQPQQYAYLKENYPEVYERVQAAVSRGQWEPVGGMWIEPDCNVVSGESLVRQFLYGQRFFEREFGRRSEVCWLPDVFGYSAAFPQIMKKAGVQYFMTIKIFWNQINKPPYQTFEWEGLDGTSILTHFSPLGDYNAAMTPAQWRKNWTEYKQKNLNDSTLYIYGYGDGGGGPTRAMIERAERGRDLPGAPRVRLTTNEAFFAELERQVDGNPMLPRWVGELYLEYHRGTYTSQARNKRSNRQSEFLLQSAEQVSSLAMLAASLPYPAQELTQMWQTLLLNQFHDIIPGSSIHGVYEDSTRDYAEITGAGSNAIDGALTALAGRIGGLAEGDVVVYNPLSWQRSELAELPAELNLPGQSVTDFDGSPKTLTLLGELPSLGYAAFSRSGGTLERLTSPGDDDSILRFSERELENRYFRILFDDHGEITSIWDKRAGREVLDQHSYCKGNALLMFEDKPMTYDAWDIDIFYQDKMSAVQAVDSIRLIEEGPLRATLEVIRSFGRGSQITQRVSVTRDLPRIDFACDVDWRERQTLLKAAFPVAVRSPRATYDIQFGNVERPTHWNTSWDWARFEVCAHKWADLSEGGYGVSLLSDSKYGWDIKGSVMRLTLLRSPVDPDPEADQGRHRFAYGLYPHEGDWRAAQTVRRAYEFNAPVRWMTAAGGTENDASAPLPRSLSLVSVDAGNIVVETVKRPEDGGSGSDELIVRCYEAHGQRGKAALRFAFPVLKAQSVNLLEDVLSDLPASALEEGGSAVSFEYGPYEILSFAVTLNPQAMRLA